MRKRMILYSSAAVLFFAAPIQAQVASHLTINAPGLNCKSLDFDSFSISAYSLESKNSGDTSGTAAVEVPSFAVGPTRFTKGVDGCSRELFEAVVTGKHISRVTLNDAGRLTITLENVIITDLVTSNDTTQFPVETISMNFSKIEYKYADGSRVCYDNSSKRKC
jgi:type VI protein secretion system component Hcp